MDPGLLYERPFTDLHFGGPEELFGEKRADELVAIVAEVNESAGMLALEVQLANKPGFRIVEGEMAHAFEVGKTYRNRYGRYQVLSIDDPKMRIRYEDGREIKVTIDIQARIWDTIQYEALQPKPAAAESKAGKKTRSPSVRQGYDFAGLQDSDFKSNVTGTSWRRRESLGGRLAQQLSDTTPYLFQCHSVYRRPSVHITMPDHYDYHDGLPFAKNELRLFPEGARYGFYIERADQSPAMDSTWHWRPFLAALETDGYLQEQLLKAMQDHDLTWLLQLEEGEDRNYSIVDTIQVHVGSPLLWKGTDAMDWSEFVSRLRAIPSNQWLNVHLCGWTDKADAVAAGERFADGVSTVFRAILPLYLASAGM